MERHILLKRFLPAVYRGAVSLLAKTPQEFEEKISSLYLDIAQDGKILFDPQGYAHREVAFGGFETPDGRYGALSQEISGRGGMEVAAKTPATLGTSVEGIIDVNPEEASYHLHLVIFEPGLKTLNAQ